MVLIRIKSCEGHIFEIDKETALQSLKIKRLYDVYKLSDDFLHVLPIPLQSSPAAAVEIFIKWAEHHKNDGEPDALKDREMISATKLPYVIEVWDLKLMDVEMELIRQVNFLAMFLQVVQLNNLTYHMINGTFRDKYELLDMKAVPTSYPSSDSSDES